MTLDDVALLDDTRATDPDACRLDPRALVGSAITRLDDARPDVRRDAREMPPLPPRFPRARVCRMSARDTTRCRMSARPPSFLLFVWETREGVRLLPTSALDVLCRACVRPRPRALPVAQVLNHVRVVARRTDAERAMRMGAAAFEHIGEWTSGRWARWRGLRVRGNGKSPVFPQAGLGRCVCVCVCVCVCLCLRELHVCCGAAGWER